MSPFRPPTFTTSSARATRQGQRNTYLSPTLNTTSGTTTTSRRTVSSGLGRTISPGPAVLDSAGLDAIASTLTSARDVEGDDDIYEHQIPAESTKRPRYANSDDPTVAWREQRDSILDHMLRQDGLVKPECRYCRNTYANGGRIFRCQDCGPSLQCRDCLETRHVQTPLHVVKEWNGEFWTGAALHRLDLKDDSPQSLRMQFQLGHDDGHCPRPLPPHRLVVIDSNGVFTLDVCPCGCSHSLRRNLMGQLIDNGWYPATVTELGTCATFRVLDLFRLLNVCGNVNAHDFVGSLERLTEPTRLGSTPDRYRAFSRIVRQYAHLKRVKRGGLAHQREGWNTRDGEPSKVRPGCLAVRCWACPQPEFNLPPDWDKCSPGDEFLYALMLALDANFRLKNRIRANERRDRSYGPGWGCFVDEGPYKEHLSDYVAEEDISTCIAFAALMQKDTRLTAGLRVSGVGGCVCARHGVIRAQGMGDLQKGERYANMDYIFMHALADARVKKLLVSYDIACQWKVNLRTRVVRIAESSRIPPNLDDFDIDFALPVWHAAAHEEECQMANSLTYCVGAARTDGEGIERTWAVLNPISFATKEMSLANRVDTLEDKMDHIGFEKNVGEGDALPRKLIIAVAERDQQIADFIEIDSSLEPATRRKWMAEVKAWQVDRSNPNLYVMKGGQAAGPSEAQVAADLKAAELKEAREGRGEFLDADMTAAAFVKALLQLEDLKRRIKNEVKGNTPMAERASQIDELRVSLLRKLRNIQRHHDTFMPGAVRLRLAEESLRDKDRPPPKAEDVKLWLPSDVPPMERGRACKRGLLEVEGQLRRAQCGDALARLRSLLHMKTHLVHHRNANAVGQRGTTRAGTLIGRVTNQIDREVAKYRQARRAMLSLMGDAYAPELRELADKDVVVHTETESDAGARLRLGRVGESRRARNEPSAAASGAVSWIWWSVRDSDVDVELHDAVRVRWAKTLARRDRWIEEVRLLQEEMRRVLRSLISISNEWRARIDCGREVEVELAAGLRAYAKRQVAIHEWIAGRFVQSWTDPDNVVMVAVLGGQARVLRDLLENVSASGYGSIAELEDSQ
ncbi:CxC2 domain-containing protein [Mycena kentingensis (nom. inval.)]|nr:CxC2 domain-containing protein [Mycena kentingensis (nom. inval.)]